MTEQGSDAAASEARAQREHLAGQIGAFIEAGVDGDARRFDELARDVFAFQYANNEPYARYCGALGIRPESVAVWDEIPPYPTQSFKNEIVASFDFDDAVMAQMTSGTTSANQRGRIFRDETGLRLVLAANRVMTGAYLFPDLAQGSRCRLLLLAPSPQMAPSMGMAIGMEETRKAFGTPDSEFMMSRRGVEVAALVDALRHAEESGAPVALIGSTSAFVYFARACRKKGLNFALPNGSRICDGGGYRGRFGELTRQDYFELCEQVLGVPAVHCVNTLGMAESATNYFDNVLRAEYQGRAPVRAKCVPPWARVRAVSVEDLTPLAPGEVGLLQHWDLANLPTVLAVQTDNLGYIDGEGGFEIVGRASKDGGRVGREPSSRTVGPMGDRPLLRVLEAYVNFSIEFKMGRLKIDQSKSATAELEKAGPHAVPSCPILVDDIIASADDPSAAARVDEALGSSSES
ncbi:MAG: LuxE/PaaK family acyltransferase [Coriobacteriia bacterium]